MGSASTNLFFDDGVQQREGTKCRHSGEFTLLSASIMHTRRSVGDEILPFLFFLVKDYKYYVVKGACS